MAAESALTRMGPDGFAAILEVIATPGLRWRGALMEGDVLFTHMQPPSTVFGPGDPNFRINSIRAAPNLLKCLEDNDAVARRSAFIMLSHSDPGVMVPALTNFLAGSPPPAIHRQAPEALANHGQDARAAVPFLLARCSNSNPEIRAEATNPLVQIAPDVLAH